MARTKIIKREEDAAVAGSRGVERGCHCGQQLPEAQIVK